MEIKIETIQPTFKDEFIKITNDFLKIFNVNKKDKLFKYLQMNDVSLVCAKKLSKGKKIIFYTFIGKGGAYSCKDCEKDPSCVICPECFEKSKDKHIGHNYSYKLNVNGCCDCGDPDSW